MMLDKKWGGWNCTTKVPAWCWCQILPIATDTWHWSVQKKKVCEVCTVLCLGAWDREAEYFSWCSRAKKTHMDFAGNGPFECSNWGDVRLTNDLIGICYFIIPSLVNSDDICLDWLMLEVVATNMKLAAGLFITYRKPTLLFKLKVESWNLSKKKG